MARLAGNWSVAIGAIVLTGGTLLAGAFGYSVYQDAVARLRSTAFGELAVIGDLKQKQIEAWRRERLVDVSLGVAVGFDYVDLARLLSNPDDASLRAHFSAHLAGLKSARNYNDAIVAAPDGRVVISLDRTLTTLDPAELDLVAKVVTSATPELGELVRDASSGSVSILAAAPIVDPLGRPAAVLVLRIDPNTELYPMIQTWPTASASGEFLLVRQDGDVMTYLNALRNSTARPMTLTIPMSRQDVPAVAAALGRTGSMEGTDYRGAAVLADIGRVIDSGWFVVAKVDLAELDPALRDRAQTILALGVLGVLLVLGAGAFGLSLRRSRLERRAKLTEERYGLAFREMAEGFCVIELMFDEQGRPADYRFLETNGAFEEQSGLRDVKGKRIRELAPNLEAYWYELYGNIALTGEPARLENEAKDLHRWFSVSAYRIGGQGSRLVAVLFNDITEVRQRNASLEQRVVDRTAELEVAIRTLRTSEDEFRSLAEAMPQIVWTTRADGWNTYFNQQWVDYTGLTLEESYGDGWLTPFHPDDKQGAWDAWQRATNHLDTYDIRCRLRRADGVYRWWLIRGVPQIDADGKILKWFGTCTDIDDINQAEMETSRLNDQLGRSNQELTKANDELTAVTYSLSHDLRAPLRAISGFAATLAGSQRHALDEKGLHYLDRIIDGANRMGILIEDLLDYARLSQANVRLEPVPLGALVDGLQSTFGERIEASGGTLEVVEPLAVPVGDPLLIERVLSNLVDNALNYRRPEVAPHVIVSATRHADRVTLAVADNGIGIAEEHQERIFEVFTRLANSEDLPGTGIGLSIVRKAAQLMGCQVTVQSVEGEGSTFSLDLAAAADETRSEQ